jgi:hypothetical protein
VKRSAARGDHQLTFGPAPSNRVAGEGGGCKKVEAFEFADEFRAVGKLIDDAREAAHITRQEACALMRIDEARYSRWVNGSPADSIDFRRLLLFMPAAFWIELLPGIHHVKGLRRLMLDRFLSAAVDLSLAVER